MIIAINIITYLQKYATALHITPKTNGILATTATFIPRPPTHTPTHQPSELYTVNKLELKRQHARAGQQAATLLLVIITTSPHLRCDN